MNTYEIIEKKRNGEELSGKEIEFLILGYARDEIPDYQMAAFLMAVYFQGMSDDETYHLVNSMIQSGEKIDLSPVQGFKVDKHSTGGVGDKVSLVLGPLVSAAGVKIPMISGRGLGHSGGTLDKLESIPGFKSNLPTKKFVQQVKEINISIIGQSSKIVPADKKMYELRDVTATIKSIPLICGSIMSKKIAEGIDGLVLDVKTGNGAFLNTFVESKYLAEKLVSIGEKFNLPTTAVITDMNEPLGYNVGNWLEVREAIEALQGDGSRDLMKISYLLGSRMLQMAGKVRGDEEGVELLKNILRSGKGYDQMLKFVSAQGGDISFLKDPDKYKKARFIEQISSPSSGYLYRINTYEIGRLAVYLGAGRNKIGDDVIPNTGIVLKKKLGDRIKKAELIAEIHSDSRNKIDYTKEKLLKAIKISEKRPSRRELIYDIIQR
ncbi:MAG: thymidine phosphorylase [Fidelibacterota bacterium]